MALGWPWKFEGEDSVPLFLQLLPRPPPSTFVPRNRFYPLLMPRP